MSCSENRQNWSTVYEGLPGALLSIWGSSSTDVWAVGGDPEDGSGPMVLHYNGSGWTRYRTKESGELYWVHGFPGGPVFMGGKNGLIFRWQNGVFEKLPTPGSNLVIGIWGADPNDVWAVGGDNTGVGGAFAWRFDGTSWRVAEGFPTDLANTVAIWKIWGTSATDVWLVGTHGTTLHFDGSKFTQVPTGIDRQLVTVHATSQRVAAVGGYGTGVILEYDGSTWTDATPTGCQQMIGLWLTEDGGYATGINGEVRRRTEQGWELEQTNLNISHPLHAVWVDPEGGVWAVGGQVLFYPLVDGVLIHKGPSVPGGTYKEEQI